MTVPRILVAGVGNIFLGDDAFGVEVAQRLARRPLPEGVRVVDFGIRGIDLTYALLDGYEAVVLVDAAPRGGAPGTVYVLEPDADAPPEPGAGGALMETHGMHPAKVLRLAAAQGSPVRRVLLVGCEPAPVGDEEVAMGLSEPVRAAVEEAVPLIESLVEKLLACEATTESLEGG
jgi:hydrogenase maturation protease